jgi:GNAT superfamily N-acetyltransferase
MPEADIAAYLTNTFTQEQLSTELRDVNTTFLTASIQNKPAGYAKLQAGQVPDCITAKPAIELVRLYALKQWWGHGVGAALMQQCLEVARQQGYVTIWLSSWKLNDRANAFYRKWKFKAVGEQPFVVGSDIQEDFVMARLL